MYILIDIEKTTSVMDENGNTLTFKKFHKAHTFLNSNFDYPENFLIIEICI